MDVPLCLRGIDRPFRVSPDDQDLRRVLLEVPADPGDRPTRSDGDDDCVELAAGLRPDLGTGLQIVRLRIGHVRVLIRLEAARDLLCEPIGDGVIGLRRIRLDRSWADHDLGSVRAEHRDLLLAHLVGHHEDAAVALLRGGDREAHARVAGGGLDDRAAGLELALGFGLLDHNKPDPVLDRAAGVEVLELGQDLRLDVATERVEPDDRCVADELQSGGILARHAQGSLVGWPRRNSLACRPFVHPDNGKEWGMKIAVVGRGNVGGGLADRWERAGHDVTRIGKEGGDVSDAEVVLVAVPGDAVADALDSVQGLDGKTVIDATNLFGIEPPPGFASNAEFIKSKTNGPTVKSFNLNFARLFDEIDEQSEKPGNIWSGDEDAREVAEQLIRDAGYDPLYGGPLENAASQEQFLKLFIGISNDIGPSFYRFRSPG